MYSEDEQRLINNALSKLDSDHIDAFQDDLWSNVIGGTLSLEDYNDFMDTFFNPVACKERGDEPLIYKIINEIDDLLNQIKTQSKNNKMNN